MLAWEEFYFLAPSLLRCISSSHLSEHIRSTVSMACDAGIGCPVHCDHLYDPQVHIIPANAEACRWHWASFLSATSTDVYVYTYSFYYFFKTKILTYFKHYFTVDMKWHLEQSRG